MPLYLPDEERREILIQYGNAWYINTFVETGTLVGDTVEALRGSFSVLHTIELDSALAAAAANRFSDDPSVHVWYGDSADVLPKVLAECPEPTLFWLDGHYCGPGSGRGHVDSPVQQELLLVLARSQDDVVLVDDARIFGGGPEEGLEGYTGYPTLDWVRDLAHDSGYHYELLDDVIRLTPV